MPDDCKNVLRHHRSGAVYKGDCLLFGEEVARCWGRDGENAFSKHPAIHHRDREMRAPSSLLWRRFTQARPARQCTESVHVNNNSCEVPMNCKAAWYKPVVAVVTRERKNPVAR